MVRIVKEIKNLKKIVPRVEIEIKSLQKLANESKSTKVVQRIKIELESLQVSTKTVPGIEMLLKSLQK